MIIQSLNGTWQLKQAPLAWGYDRSMDVERDRSGWLDADVPGDIRQTLLRHDLIDDPVIKRNSFESEWIEDRSWWYRLEFDLEPGLRQTGRVELVLESLDAEADVFLNGRHVGHHQSTFYPFTAYVKEILQPAGNVLLIRVTSGLERIPWSETTRFAASVSKTDGRGDERRVFVRKPQYVFGWDWGPRVATCGVVGRVELRGSERHAIRWVHVTTRELSNDRAVLDIDTEIEVLHDYRTFDAVVEWTATGPDGASVHERRRVLLQSGLNHVVGTLEIDAPQIWWPNGWGEQPLYDIETTVQLTGGGTESHRVRTGIRTVELDTEPIAAGSERMFALRVNGTTIFAKGGNWIPADSIYARVDDAKYRRLISEAAEAHFTMLRIWGGGIYERDVFYEECDRHGMLVWHDFMFACAIYPDDREWFRLESEHEIEYQTRRLRNHPSMALWCGNNENHWGFHDWWVGESSPEFAGGAIVYNAIAPEIVRRNCPEIPYWRSSPYGGEDPNGNEVGDRHHWHDCTMNPDMEKRITPEEYDLVRSKFVSEYGYIGPCCRSTIERYHDGEPIDRGSPIWDWHNNTFEKDTVAAGIRKHYIDPETLDLEGYMLYAGLVQALMYGYSLESIRCVEHCNGSLFWMYNDCWGEVGWTIIDYYLYRKPSYYAVRRAFAPLRLILREDETDVLVYGVNDSTADHSVDLEYGYLPFDRGTPNTDSIRLMLPAGQTGIVHRFARSQTAPASGIHFVRPTEATTPIEPATLRPGVFRGLQAAAPRLDISDVESTDTGCHFTVASEGFAHAVHFGFGDEARYSDAFFDLLPGERRQIEMTGVGYAGTVEARCVLPNGTIKSVTK